MFTVGNVIVLGIVLVVLAVYRQIDRNNRSLEKVKRYADKVQSDLDTIVTQKATELRDISIEVSVHQKAAREVLKRIQAIEESLTGRAEQIDQIGARIGEYDTALEELVQMTRRVEENINRIKDESEYVDKVGKRLKASAARMTEIEQSIPGLVDSFTRQNEAALEKSRVDVLAESEQRVAELSSQVQQVGSDVHGMVHQIEEAHESYSRRLQEAESEFSARLDTVAARGERLETAALQKLREHVEARMRAAASELSTEIAATRKAADSEREQAVAEMAVFRDKLAERLEELESGVQDLDRRLESTLSEAEATSRRASDAVVRSINEELDRTSSDLQMRVSQSQAEFRSELDRIATLQKQWDEARQALSVQLETSNKELSERIGAFTKTLSGRIDSRSEEIEHQVVSRLETRLSEYEQEMGYRFTKLESVQADVDALEANLRESMGKMTSRLKEELSVLGTQLRDERKSDIEQHEGEMVRLRGEMVELEQGLNELKSRAYESVSEKLRIFEDEFFGDLRERSVAMEKRLDEWQLEVQATLAAMEKESATERDRVETSYSEELSSRLKELQSRLFGQFERLEEQVEQFRTGTNDAVAATERAVSRLKEELNADAERIESAARADFERRFESHDAGVTEEIKKFEKTIAARFREIEGGVEVGRKNVDAAMEAARSDVTVWQSKVMQQLQASEAEVNNDFAGFRVTVSDTISEIRENFELQKDDLITATSEERERLKVELSGLGERISTLEEQLAERSNAVLEEFRNNQNQFESDFQRRVRDAQSDADAKMREFRTFIHETREQFDAMQHQLFGRIEEQANVLTVNLGEIDKRLRGFVDQTRIFERSDSLRDSLLAAVEDMKVEISSVNQQRKDLKGIEIEFVRLKKLGEDASEKLSRFTGEKRRIDGLEEDYKRLIGMSQAVELKLEQVTNSNDTLAQMQLALRNLDDLEKDVESRFQRLEKRKAMLDVTAEGVDKNFQYLEELESKIDAMRTQVNELPTQLEELFDKVGQLSANRKDVDTAVKQLDGLSTLLSDVEGRMETLQTAREWLARTETRLEEISRGAEEQVKLLGSLIKDEVKGSREKVSGAPSLTARDTVIKLARQGWKVQEIAHATKLSRGEVELILEIAHK